VFLTAEDLARTIGVPIEEVNYVCAGINHMAFYLRFERKTADGIEDLYPRIHQLVEEGRVPSWNRVRYEMFSKLGYFVTESSEHFAEYVPWFIKRDRPDLIERFNIPLDEYPRRCEAQIAAWEALRAYLEAPETALAVERTREYGSYIIHSLETGTPRVIYGNVPNRGLIDNLPQDCIVEVPCLVDNNGIQPTRIGALPPHLAALMQTNINVQALAVEAALTQRREYVYHAAMLDPHTGAELDLDQICSLVDDLIETHGGWLPAYD
jgi:alpha-galactosidase